MENYRKKIISELKKILEKEKGIVFAYLFGSISNNTYNSKSDIDVALFLEEDGDYFEKKLQIMEAIERKFKKSADVVILNNAKSSFLKYVIIKEGTVVLERKRDCRTNFEFKTMQEYFDYAPISKMYNDALLSKI